MTSYLHVHLSSLKSLYLNQKRKDFRRANKRKWSFISLLLERKFTEQIITESFLERSVSQHTNGPRIRGLLNCVTSSFREEMSLAKQVFVSLVDLKYLKKKSSNPKSLFLSRWNPGIQNLITIMAIIFLFQIYQFLLFTKNNPYQNNLFLLSLYSFIHPSVFIRVIGSQAWGYSGGAVQC